MTPRTAPWKLVRVFFPLLSAPTLSRILSAYSITSIPQLMEYVHGRYGTGNGVLSDKDRDTFDKIVLTLRRVFLTEERT